MKSIPLFATVLLIVSAGSVQAAQKLVVPGYFPVGSDWTRIENAGSSVSIVVALGGQGGFQTLVGAGLADAQAQFGRCRAAGQAVLGYVDTAHGPAGPRTVQDVADEVGLWYDKYSGYIDGIFLDNGPEFPLGGKTDQDYQDWYQWLSLYLLESYGVNFLMLNASQYPYEWVAQTFPYVLIWENSYANYRSDATYKAIGPDGNLEAPPGWWSSATYQGQLAHVITDASSANIADIVSLSRSRGSPLVFIHNQTADSYSPLTPYFETEVTAITGP